MEARITAGVPPERTYFFQLVRHQEVMIAVGKYQSEQLSIKIRRLWERLDTW